MQAHHGKELTAQPLLVPRRQGGFAVVLVVLAHQGFDHAVIRRQPHHVAVAQARERTTSMRFGPDMDRRWHLD